eukprot:GHVS01001140.1.p1 GENE.GHVS01001140.1~~GHVS01001140.1.p1  ORF type:complete len:298 (-),score=17.08 GHVS01001140.1:123-1016(-)
MVVPYRVATQMIISLVQCIVFCLYMRLSICAAQLEVLPISDENQPQALRLDGWALMHGMSRKEDTVYSGDRRLFHEETSTNVWNSPTGDEGWNQLGLWIIENNIHFGEDRLRITENFSQSFTKIIGATKDGDDLKVHVDGWTRELFSMQKSEVNDKDPLDVLASLKREYELKTQIWKLRPVVRSDELTELLNDEKRVLVKCGESSEYVTACSRRNEELVTLRLRREDGKDASKCQLKSTTGWFSLTENEPTYVWFSDVELTNEVSLYICGTILFFYCCICWLKSAVAVQGSDGIRTS